MPQCCCLKRTSYHRDQSSRQRWKHNALRNSFMVAEGPVAKRLISAILRYNYGMNPLGSLSSAKKRGHVSKIESLPGLSSRANLRRRTTRCRPERRRFYSGTANRNARSAGAASRSTSSVKRPLESKKRNARPETEKWCASYSAGNRR